MRFGKKPASSQPERQAVLSGRTFAEDIRVENYRIDSEALKEDDLQGFMTSIQELMERLKGKDRSVKQKLLQSAVCQYAFMPLFLSYPSLREQRIDNIDQNTRLYVKRHTDEADITNILNEQKRSLAEHEQRYNELCAFMKESPRLRRRRRSDV